VSLKKKKQTKVLLRAQTNKQTKVLLRSQTNKQTRVLLQAYKDIYICGVHLGLLPQTSLGGLRLLSSPFLSLLVLVRLLPWGYLGFHLYLYLFYFASMFNSFRISTQVCRCACLFNSLEICTQVLSVLTYEGVLGEWSIGDDKGELTRDPQGSLLAGEKQLAKKFGDDFDLRGSPWKCVIHWGRFSFFLHGLLGNLCWLYPQGSFINSMRIIFFTTYEGVAIVPWTHGGFPSWYCTLLGICLKIWTLEEALLVTCGSLKDALDAFNLLWMLLWSLRLLPNWGYFVHFVMFLNFFLALPTFSRIY